jgi:hypothetical protein
MGSENTLLVVGANPGSSNTFSEDGDQRHEGSEVCVISSEFQLLKQMDGGTCQVDMLISQCTPYSQ